MLTQRDIAIAEWVGRQGAARAEHVMARFSIGRTAAYRRLHELVDFGLLRMRPASDAAFLPVVTLKTPRDS